MNVKWMFMDTSNGSLSKKQHGFVADFHGKNKAQSNISFCGKMYIVNKNKKRLSLEEIEGQEIDVNVCEKCLSISAKYKTTPTK